MSDETQVRHEVEVVHGPLPIGSGVAIAWVSFPSAGALNVSGHYEWPPNAPAEVGFTFRVTLEEDRTCAVEVDWPGLLGRPIAADDAHWIGIVVFARSGLLITTPDGDQISFFYAGPPSDPEETTGFQISVLERNLESSAALAFRYP